MTDTTNVRFARSGGGAYCSPLASRRRASSRNVRNTATTLTDISALATQNPSTRLVPLGWRK